MAKQHLELRWASERGVVEVLHCDVSDVARIDVSEEYHEDFIGGYFFQIDAQRLLFVRDWDVNEEQQREQCFPCRRFDIIRLPDNGPILKIKCTGPPLSPSHTRTLVDDEREPLPRETCLLTGRLDQLDAVIAANSQREVHRQ